MENFKELATIESIDTESFIIVNDKATEKPVKISVQEFLSSAGQQGLIPNTDWLYKEVDISSADILNIGTTPVELLPAPGVNKYYFVNISVEYTHNTTAYIFDGMRGYL